LLLLNVAVAATAADEPCRDPAETRHGLSCETCCIGDDDGACTYKSVDLGGLSEADTSAWWAKQTRDWNVQSTLMSNRGNKTCAQGFPQGCAPCAACTLDMEAGFPDLKSRLQNMNCECVGPFEVDRCFFRFSCGCFCQRLVRMLGSCPHLDASFVNMTNITIPSLVYPNGTWIQPSPSAEPTTSAAVGMSSWSSASAFPASLAVAAIAAAQY